MKYDPLAAIREATRGTPFEGDLWLVGGAVRDELLGGQGAKDDLDLVTRGNSADLAHLLFDKGLSDFAPVTFERFGTAMVRVEGTDIELVTARRESYDEESRKPNVQPASYEEDAARRDFTVNTLMRSVHTGELWDPLGKGLADLEARVLRTPLNPVETFHDDPLRMMRAVRFRWKLGFSPAPGLYESIRETCDRLKIISMERIRDELLKMLSHPSASNALPDLADLGLMEIFAPELLLMQGVEQGKFHHLDVWNHTLKVLENAGPSDPLLALGALLHDIGKPSTRSIDEKGNTRFFGHEDVGAKMANELLRRLKLPQRDIDVVVALVKNHMRLGTSPGFTPSAARRLLRDMDGNVERLLQLVEADANGLKAGVRVVDLSPIRQRLEQVQAATPVSTLVSPLSGEEIMAITGLEQGQEVGRLKKMLTEMVLEGELMPDDKEKARTIVESAS